jgi:membrane dipeptidase
MRLLLTFALTLALALAAAAQRRVPIVADGHVHITNRVYWEGIDPWKAQPVGQWDYQRARAGGVNFVIESVAPYGYQTYNTTVKHAGRLIETFHRAMEAHKKEMALALTVADVRRIVATGRMAVMLGIEAGFDQDGDIDILRLWYRLGVRVIQFSSQNTTAFADSAVRGEPHWGGINDKGRRLIEEMNRLGMIIDITHATEAAQRQIIEASRAPVIASHVALRAVNANPGNMTDEVLRAIAAKGGMVGIHSSADLVGARYYNWAKGKPSTPVNGIRREEILYAELPLERSRNRDYGEYIDAVDAELGGRWKKLYAMPWKEDPAAMEFVPSLDEYIDHIAHAVQMAGPQSVAIGLDLTNARSTLLDGQGKAFDAGRYPDLFAALKRRKLATPGILGENWLAAIGRIEAVANQLRK